MNTEPDEIHFDCPKCKRPMSGDRALLNEMIACPDCNEPFIPTPRKSAPEPKLAKQEFGVECPRCHKVFFTEIKRLSGDFVTCPNCAAAFSPVQSTNAQTAVQKEVSTRADRIRSQARFFTVVAGLFCGIGLLVAFGSAYNSISGDGAGGGFIVAASLIGAALWFYLIAQIIHIRANTEK